MEKKGVLRSRTVWGGIIAALPAVDHLLVALNLFGAPFLGELASIVVPAIGGVLSIFGRVKADTKIKGVM